ncbi:MAG: copper ion binding protein [Prevotella sp.]|nr:copper ion binding protein [Prevotella sp.]
MIKKIMLLAVALLQMAGASAADSDTLTVRIKGMRCGECAHKVKTALRQDKGVKDIVFNLERRTATISYDPAATSTDSICARLTKTKRYKATPYSKNDIIHRGIDFRMDDMHCQKCADRIMGRLGKLEGIDSMSPHLDKHYMFIRYNANRTCKDSIRTAINKLGYTPVNYYTSNKIGFAYYNIPSGTVAPEAIDAILALDAVDDVNINTRRKTMAVTYFCKELTAEQLLEAIHKAGINAVVPPPHKCTEEQK